MAKFEEGISLLDDIEAGFSDCKEFVEFFSGATGEGLEILRTWAESLILGASKRIKCNTEEDFFSTPECIVRTMTELLKPPRKPLDDRDEDTTEPEKKEEERTNLNIIKMITSYQPQGRSVQASYLRTLAVGKLLIILSYCQGRLCKDWLNTDEEIKHKAKARFEKILKEASTSAEKNLAVLYLKSFFASSIFPTLTAKDHLFPGNKFLDALKSMELMRIQAEKVAKEVIKFAVPHSDTIIKIFFVCVWKMSLMNETSSKLIKYLGEVISSSCKTELEELLKDSTYSVSAKRSFDDDYTWIATNFLEIYRSQLGNPDIQKITNGLSSLLNNIIKLNPRLFPTCTRELFENRGDKLIKVNLDDQKLTQPLHARKNLLDRLKTLSKMYADASSLGICDKICRLPDDILKINVKDEGLNIPESSDFDLLVASYADKLEPAHDFQRQVAEEVFGVVIPATEVKTEVGKLAASLRSAVISAVGAHEKNIVNVLFESQVFLSKIGTQLELVKKNLTKIFRNPTVGFSRLESNRLRLIGVFSGQNNTKTLDTASFAIHFRNGTIHPITESISKINFYSIFEDLIDKPLAEKTSFKKETAELLKKFLNILISNDINSIGIGGSDWSSEEIEIIFLKIFKFGEIKEIPRIRCFSAETCGMFSLVSSLAPPKITGQYQSDFFRITTGIAISCEFGALGVALESMALRTGEDEVFTLEDVDPACGKAILPDEEKDRSLNIKRGLLLDFIERVDVDANWLTSYPLAPLMCYILDVSPKRSKVLCDKAAGAEEDRLNQEVWRKVARDPSCPFILKVSLPSTLKLPEKIDLSLSKCRILLNCAELVEDMKLKDQVLKTLKMSKGWLEKNRSRVYFSQLRLSSEEGVNLDGLEYFAVEGLFPVPHTTWKKVRQIVLENFTDQELVAFAPGVVDSIFASIKPSAEIRTTSVFGLLGKALVTGLKKATDYANKFDKEMKDGSFKISSPAAYFAGGQRSPTQDTGLEQTMLHTTDNSTMSSGLLSSIAFVFKHLVNQVHFNNFTVVDRLSLPKDESRMDKLNSLLPPDRYFAVLTSGDLIRYSDATEVRVRSLDVEPEDPYAKPPELTGDLPMIQRKLVERRVGTHPKLSFVVCDFLDVLKCCWACCNSFRDRKYRYKAIFAHQRVIYLNSQQYRLPFKFPVLHLDVDNYRIKKFNHKYFESLKMKKLYNIKAFKSLEIEQEKLIRAINFSINKLKDRSIALLDPKNLPDGLALIPEKLYSLKTSQAMYVRVMAHKTTDQLPFHLHSATDKLPSRIPRNLSKSRDSSRPGSSKGTGGGDKKTGGDGKKPEEKKGSADSETTDSDEYSKGGGAQDGEEDPDDVPVEIPADAVEREVVEPAGCLQKFLASKKGNDKIKIASSKKQNHRLAPKTRPPSAIPRKIVPRPAETRPTSAPPKKSNICPTKTSRTLSSTSKEVNKTAPAANATGLKRMKKSPSLQLHWPTSRASRNLGKNWTKEMCPKPGTSKSLIARKDSSLESINSSSSRLEFKLDSSNETTSTPRRNLSKLDFFGKRSFK